MAASGWFDENDDDGDSDDYPYDDDYDDELDDEFDDDEAELIPCPNCGQSVYEEAPQCPNCGEYIVVSTSPWIGRPWWWMLLGIVGLTGVVLALVRGI